MMNEEEILNAFGNERRFLGVFACNELCSVKLDTDSGLIFNTSPRDVSNNGHWIAVYKNKNNVVYFLDSLHLDFMFSNHYVTSFLKYNNVQYVKTLCFPVQPIRSNLCGVYCIYFIICFLNNVSFNKLVNIFDAKNLYVNDYVVCTYVINALK